jgi:hypothetical protein
MMKKCVWVRAVVSLVSVAARNRCYLCGTLERVAECDSVEIANVHAVFMHAAENMIGCSLKLGVSHPLRHTLQVLYF